MTKSHRQHDPLTPLPGTGSAGREIEPSDIPPERSDAAGEPRTMPIGKPMSDADFDLLKAAARTALPLPRSNVQHDE